MLDRYARFLVRKSQATIDAALRSVVRSAYSHISRFRISLDAVGIDPEAIQSQADLRRLPISSRDEFSGSSISAHTHRDINFSQCYKSTTSGTTGVPLDIYMSRSEAAYRKLVLFNAIRKNIRLTLPLRIVEVGTGAVGIIKRRKARCSDPVNVFHISRTLPITEQLELLVQARPHVITGHPSCLELVAEELNWRPGGFAPRLTVCRGELLSDSTRSKLWESFGCKAVDYYSCDEVGNIAWECPGNMHKLHISTDGCMVEVVDESGSLLPVGTEGRILVTNLFNHTMSFIRYSLGDRGSLLGEKVCPSCGFLGPSLALVAGRLEDYYLLPDGRKLSPRVIDSLMMVSAFPTSGGEGYYAKQYQCIQETRGMIRVLVIPADHAPNDLAARISRAIESIGPGITCRVEYVDAFPSSLSGKHRSIVSRVRV